VRHHTGTIRSRQVSLNTEFAKRKPNAALTCTMLSALRGCLWYAETPQAFCLQLDHATPMVAGMMALSRLCQTLDQPTTIRS
jgi:hypothetical protein